MATYSNVLLHPSRGIRIDEEFVLTSESLGLSCSLDSNRQSISSRSSKGERRSRRNSAESSGQLMGRHKNGWQLIATSLKPFKLRTKCLVKPPVKESTKPTDLVLHSDIWAEERVAEKLTLIEQYKMERERQQKLAEEEEIKKLKKELIPKAQPMPYFDKPFVPRRSEKNPTIPKEPKFHLPQHKKIKCSMSWSESSYYAQLQ